MNFDNIIEMDIWSNFGCFSKPFSTTGGLLTYLIPPKTSIIGIIGAVLGYDFDDFEKISDNKNKYSIEDLFNIKISIQPLFDLRTKRVTFNRISGTVNKPSIANIHQDILINPYYKLFITFPDSLKNEEEIFIKRIKNHQTVFNLYMGRNEFPLSYKLCNITDYESTYITKDNVDDFFSNNDVKIYGLLNRALIKNTDMKSVLKKDTLNNEIIFNFKKDGEVELNSYFEYIIPEYPIKRNNFTEFTFSEVSFYVSNNFKDDYFSNIELKENISDEYFELIKIGENEWISMI